MTSQSSVVGVQLLVVSRQWSVVTCKNKLVDSLLLTTNRLTTKN